MSNNIFSGKRFMLLWRQHLIQNTQLLLLSTVGYVGVIFFILSMVQLGNELQPHDIENFGALLLTFVGIFGVLYIGHSFPAFRSKERSINYLLIPASALEKFLFEFLSRIGIVLIVLPFLYWVTFHLQGYFITMFTDHVFEPIGIKYLAEMELPQVDSFPWIVTLVILGVMLGFVLAFTGAATFTKQPLVKTLFALAVIMIIYSGFTYIVLEQFGVGKYSPMDTMWLVPTNEKGAFRFFATALFVGNLIMLFVAYRKLKEREV